MKSIFSILLFLVLAACSKHEIALKKDPPAKVEKSDISGGIARLTLTAEARQRLGIESRAFPTSGRGQRTVPVSALLYDNEGAAWVFVEPERTHFHRERIRVLKTRDHQIHIESSFNDAVPIVIEGAAELSGVESGVGK